MLPDDPVRQPGDDENREDCGKRAQRHQTQLLNFKFVGTQGVGRVKHHSVRWNARRQ
jgi:hypothetical protein